MPTRVRALAATALTVLALAGATSPPTSDSFRDLRANSCQPRPAGGCAYGIVVNYWRKAGSAQRHVAWVRASRSPVARGAVYRAQWSYQEPGRVARVGGGWRRGAVVHSWHEVTWGRGGHTGPAVAPGTRVCVLFNFGSARQCVELH
ncbi:hypothetical protein GCM10010278_68790 [Streptomyces melanogenes]|nr:hypothetical protein GCM10010278_68790 [Streptomyces melanogenes]